VGRRKLMTGIYSIMMWPTASWMENEPSHGQGTQLSNQLER